MREMRSISFDERESVTAIIGLIRRQRQPLPPGQIGQLRLFSRPTAAELLIVDDFGTEASIKRTSAELAASLVSYCIDRRIRLPSKGLKFVEVIGGRLNLIIYLEDMRPTKGKVARQTAGGRT